jgi:hypothetical protein
MTDLFLDCSGRSGRIYRYFLIKNPTVFGVSAKAGNYCFAVVQSSGLYLPVYFGVADDLSVRLPNHERLPEARLLGRVSVWAHTTQDGDLARRAEERDLIQYWNPILNVQHRTVG